MTEKPKCSEILERIDYAVRNEISNLLYNSGNHLSKCDECLSDFNSFSDSFMRVIGDLKKAKICTASKD